jgi:hypothetical protein
MDRHISKHARLFPLWLLNIQRLERLFKLSRNIKTLTPVNHLVGKGN